MGFAFYGMLLPMPDDSIPPCHCGMKWRRKCGGKRKNCFVLEAFVNDSPFSFRLEWFSSFTALCVFKYGETTSGSPSARDAIIWQDSIADMPLAFMIIKETVEKKLSYDTNISISQHFQRQIRCNQLWGWIFKFCSHSAPFLSVAWDLRPWKIKRILRWKRNFSIIFEMASYLTVSGDVASLVNSAFNIHIVACPGEVGERESYLIWYYQVMIYGLLSFFWHLSRLFIVHNLTKCLSGFSCSSMGAAEF